MNPQARTCLLLSTFLLPTVVASAQPPATPVTQQSAPAPEALGPAFEVATIKPSPKDGLSPGQWSGLRVLPSGRISVHSATLRYLVGTAYSDLSRPLKFLGGPSWADSDDYDIEAKIDEAQMASWEKLSDKERTAVVHPTLRTLLADRFHLKLHPEMRETPVYALVQAKGGAKLTPANTPLPLEGDGDISQKLSRWMAAHPGQSPPGAMMCHPGGCKGQAVEIRNIAATVGAQADADRIVIDATGLTGLYDFSFTISHDPDALTPMQQIEDQLGLRFESRKSPSKPTSSTPPINLHRTNRQHSFDPYRRLN